MPAGDRTGPLGEGARTGRGVGDCSPADRSGDERFGFGMGRAFRGGRRRGHRFFPFERGGRGFQGIRTANAQSQTDDDLEVLQREANWLKQRLEVVSGRIDAFRKE